MDTCTYDVIVVGAGIMGLSTAWHLVHKENKRVLLLDQFPFPTTRNCSNGQSRIYRRSYTDPLYSAMMDKAMPLWRELEEMSKKSLLFECGLLYGGDTEVIDLVKNALAENKSPHQCYQYRDLVKKWPKIKGFQDNAEFVYEPSGGFIAAAEAMQAYHQCLMTAREKFTFLPKTTVLSIHPSTVCDKVRVVSTDQKEFIGKSLVLTPGPWATKLLQQIGCPLPLEPQKVAVAYFNVLNENDHSFRYQNFPTVILEYKDSVVYFLPEAEYRGMIKVGNHVRIPKNPDCRDSKMSELQAIVEPMTDKVRQHFPNIESTPAIIENCSYCCTPDHHYIIDQHPQYRNIVIGTGFSGHGFKMAPIVGQLLGNLCLGDKPDIDTSKFQFSRFKPNSKL